MNNINNTDVFKNVDDSNLRRNWIREHFLIIFYTVVAAIILRLFVVEIFVIPTSSMTNTLLEGDYIIVNKIVYGIKTPKYFPFSNYEIPRLMLPAFNEPKRGEILVFHYPGDRDQVKNPDPINYIKRCVAVGGDTVKISNRKIFVNGVAFPKIETAKIDSNYFVADYVEKNIFPEGAPFNSDNYGPIIVPKKGNKIHLTAGNYKQWEIIIKREGHDITLGPDNSIFLNSLIDSVYTIEKNYVFVIGDNRGNSIDSRYWGFLPDDEIIGKAVMVFWSWNPEIPLQKFSEKINTIRWLRIGTFVK